MEFKLNIPPRTLGNSLLAAGGVGFAAAQWHAADRANRITQRYNRLPTVTTVRDSYRTGLMSAEEGLKYCKDQGVCSIQDCFGPLAPQVESKLLETKKQYHSKGTQTDNFKSDGSSKLSSITLSRWTKPQQVTYIASIPEKPYSKSDQQFPFQFSSFSIFISCAVITVPVYLSIIYLIRRSKISHTWLYQYITTMFKSNLEITINEKFEKLEKKIENQNNQINTLIDINEKQTLLLKDLKKM